MPLDVNPIIVTPSELILALESLYAANQPVYIEGSPGIGKTSILRQFADHMKSKIPDFGFYSYVLSQFERVDFTGVPEIINHRTRWAPPDIFPTSGCGLYNFDEFNAAPRELQPPLYQLFEERRIGDFHLPSGYLPVATGNLTTDRAIVNKLSLAFTNRVTILQLIRHLDDFCKWGVCNGILPVITAFARFRQDLFDNGFDPNQRINLTPRSLEKVSNILKTNPPKSIEMQLIAGTIGERHAAELTGFLRLWRSLPSLDSILLNPDTAPVPTDSATLYAVAGGLARKSTEQNFDRVMTYANRMPEAWQVYTVKDASRRDENVQNTNAFIKWASLHSEVMG